MEEQQEEKVSSKALFLYYGVLHLLLVGSFIYLMAFRVPQYSRWFKEVLGPEPLPVLMEIVIGISNLVKERILILLPLPALLDIVILAVTCRMRSKWVVRAWTLILAAGLIAAFIVTWLAITMVKTRIADQLGG